MELKKSEMAAVMAMIAVEWFEVFGIYYGSIYLS